METTYELVPLGYDEDGLPGLRLRIVVHDYENAQDFVVYYDLWMHNVQGDRAPNEWGWEPHKQFIDLLCTEGVEAAALWQLQYRNFR